MMSIFWWIWWAYFDVMWKHKCYKYFKESNYELQDKTHSYQVSLSMRTSCREEYQDGIYWDKGTNCRHIYKSSSKR